jgi:hypothetical protein
MEDVKKFTINVNEVETQLINKNVFMYVDINNNVNQYETLSKTKISKTYLHSNYRSRYQMT